MTFSYFEIVLKKGFTPLQSVVDIYGPSSLMREANDRVARLSNILGLQSIGVLAGT